MSKFDAKKVLEGGVDNIVAGFGDLNDAQLQELHDTESKAGKRTTLTNAIRSEQNARAENAKVKAAIDAAAKDGVKLFSQADLDAQKADHEDRISKLEEQLKAAKTTTRPARAVKAEKPRKLALTGEGGALDGAVRVAFTGDDDTTIADLPDLEFASSDFIPGVGDTVMLKQPIVFPEGARRASIKKVWLVGENGKAVAVSELVNPLPVGGGTSAEIPAKWLAFRGAAPAKADAETEGAKAA